MNAYVSKQEMAYRMPESLSHYFKDEVPYMPQPEPQGISLFARIGAGLRRLAQLPARRAVINELQTVRDMLHKEGDRVSREIAGYASGYDNRTSLLLFRHPGVNALVQCGVLYDVTRNPRTIVNCYELK